MAFAFEKLIVYQKAIDFADAACQLTRQFPGGYFFLADQLNRAALSIAANIAEGNGRFTIPDRRNFFGIARGSVDKTSRPAETGPVAGDQKKALAGLRDRDRIAEEPQDGRGWSSSGKSRIIEPSRHTGPVGREARP